MFPVTYLIHEKVFVPVPGTDVSRMVISDPGSSLLLVRPYRFAPRARGYTTVIRGPALGTTQIRGNLNTLILCSTWSVIGNTSFKRNSETIIPIGWSTLQAHNQRPDEEKDK